MNNYEKWMRFNKITKTICWGLEILVVFAFIAMAATIGDKNREIKKLEKQIEQYEHIR